jgi:hypothetical protein
MLPLPQTPFAFDVTRFFQFILYAFMVSPGNFVWQRWLETKFPAYDRKLYGEKKEEYVDDYVTGQTTKKVGDKKKAVPNELGARERSQSLNLRNTFVKFALDSTVGTCINVSPLSPSLSPPSSSCSFSSSCFFRPCATSKSPPPRRKITTLN